MNKVDRLIKLLELRPEDINPPSDIWKDFKIGDKISDAKGARQAVSLNRKTAKVTDIIFNKKNKFRAIRVKWNNGDTEDIGFPELNFIEQV